jgi:aerobic-type carbon monoxide dehydrogenase small subunit (CoxS/CutS family)
MSIHDITITVNGTSRPATAEARTSLADLLRNGLRLTGTHVACEEGACGACTVLLDGIPVRSCLLLAVQADGHRVETVECLAPDGGLSALQQAMRDSHGLQCGFCTPGLLMSLTAAERDGMTAEETIRTVLPGHLCRCTGYAGIRTAVERHWQRTEASQ